MKTLCALLPVALAACSSFPELRIKAAEDFARTSPFPAPEEALEHVFA